MSKQKMEMKQLLIPANEVINGFCYAFSKELLKKLKALMNEDRLFKEGNTMAREKEGRNTSSYFTPITRSIISHLKEQIHFYTQISEMPRDVDNIVITVEEFLAIFEKKQ